MIRNPKLWMPLAVLAAGVLGAVVLVATGPEPQTMAPRLAVPLVRTVSVDAREVQLSITTHGTVAPRTESELVPEIAGRVVWVSPALASGGFFEEGDPLLRIEPADYEVSLERARAQRERAASEDTLARKELARQEQLAEREVASASRLDDARNREKVARASLREASASLRQAERDLDRTELRAPYAGRVREENVDVGQFVNRGVSVARIYAVDYAEVRLPIRDEELAFIDLPTGGAPDEGARPEVVLRARYAGADREWRGRIVRTEGEIDPQSRMVHVVARVEDPYGRDGRAGRPPFPVGLFVDAEILGRRAVDVVVLPRGALRDGDRVLVVDDEDRLRFRDVSVMRRGRSEAYIDRGLEPGERVCVTSLETPVEGMQVRPVASGDSVSVTAEPAASGSSS